MKKLITSLFLLVPVLSWSQQQNGFLFKGDCYESLDAACSAAEADFKARSSKLFSQWKDIKFERGTCGLVDNVYRYKAYYKGSNLSGVYLGAFAVANDVFGSCVKTENKCSSKKGQKHGDGTASATVTGKENVDRFLSRIGKGPISLCRDGCVIKGSPSVAVCEESNCPFTLENVTYTGGQCKGNGTSLDEPQNPNPETPKPPKEETLKPKEPEEPLVCPISKNQCPGVVNGKRVCVPCGDSDASPKPPKPGASNAAGSGNGQGTGDGKGGSGNGQGTGNGNGQGSGTGPGSGGGSGGGKGGGNGAGNGTGTGPGSGSGSGGGNGDGNGKGDGKGDKEEGEDGAGPSFGERPGLYEPKYKNGIKGVWDQKKGQLQNSGLGRLSKRLMPTVNSGNCPRWDIDLNFGRNMNFGTKNVAPPCTIWPILRAIVMVCALLLARRLVFGG